MYICKKRMAINCHSLDGRQTAFGVQTLSAVFLEENEKKKIIRF